MTATLRACTVCGRATSIGSRCTRHVKPRPYRTMEYREARAWTLLEEQTCWICGLAAMAGDPLTADHVIPVDHGGSSDRSNLRAAHLSCNSRRGAQQQ